MTLDEFVAWNRRLLEEMGLIPRGGSMSIRNLQWIKGAPERLEPGMLLLYGTGSVLIVGDCSDAMPDGVSAWAWLVKPHTVEWIEDMARAHGVGR